MQNRAFVAGELTTTEDRLPPAFAAAWLLAFSIPWDDMIQLPGNVQLARVLALVVGVIWLASTLRGGSVRRPVAAHAWMAVFLLWASVSIFWSEDPDRTLRRSLSYLQLGLLAWVIFQFASSKSHHLRLMQAFVLGEWVLVARVAMAFLNGEVWGEGRYTAPGVNPNDLAGTLALGIPIASYLTAAGGRRFGWLNAVYVPAAVFCIFLNASRTGLLASACALVFPVALVSGVSWKTRIAALAVVVSGLLLLGTLSDSVPWKRLSSVGEQVSARDLNGRMDVWATALDLFESHPIVGLGAGTFVATTGSMQALAIAGHNSFVEVLVENGAVGLALFLAVVVSIYRARPRNIRIERQLWPILLATWAIINCANSWENKNVSWLIFGLALGYPAARRMTTTMRWTYPLETGIRASRSLS